MAVFSREHGMVVAAWKSDAIDQEFGYLYITTAGSANFYKKKNLGKKILKTFANLPSRDAIVQYPPSVNDGSDQIFRYKIDLETFMNLLRCRTYHGFFNCKL